MTTPTKQMQIRRLMVLKNRILLMAKETRGKPSSSCQNVTWSWIGTGHIHWSTIPLLPEIDRELHPVVRVQSSMHTINRVTTLPGHIITIIKFNRLRKAGYTAKADEKYVQKRILMGEAGVKRLQGRTRLRWRVRMDEGVKKIVAPNWRRFAREREECRGNRRKWRPTSDWSTYLKQNILTWTIISQ